MSVVTGILIVFSCSEDFNEDADGYDTYPIIEEGNYPRHVSNA